jgi:peptidyl-prolyl cis-trans isomerase C
MKRHCWILIVVLAAAAIAQDMASSHSSAFDNTPAPKPTGKAVARVNGVALTDVDLMREMLVMFPYARQHGGKVPKTLEAGIRTGALQMIEFEELVYQEAERRKMQISATRLKSALAEFKKQFNSDSDFHGFLVAEFQGSEVALRKRIRRSLLIDDLLDLEVTQKSAVRGSEVRAHYDQNLAKFHEPRKASIQTISIVIPDEATAFEQADSRRRAEEALRKAKATKNFEEFGALAEKVSEDEWRVMMGNHGSIGEEKMPPEVAQAVFGMKPGQVSELIKAENSYCIVRLNQLETARQLPFEQVRAQIVKDLKARRVDQLRSALNRRLRKAAKVEEIS